MSAQQLADRCADLGHPGLQRNVISNLENGFRRNASVADVLVLAEALGVAPAALMFPVGYAPAVEYLPGQTASPLDAVDWLAGEVAGDGGEESALALLRRHRDLERRIRGVYRRIWEQGIADQRYGLEELEDAEAEAGRDMARELAVQLQELRTEMAARGLEVPPTSVLDQPNRG
jgi:transcriptional regulator with XRE-family HTH domain